MKFKKAIAFLLLLLIPASGLQAYWVWSPEQGKFVNADGEAQGSAEEQYNYALKLYKDKNNKEAIDQLKSLLKNTPSAHIAPEAQYRLGTIYEETGEYMKAFKTYQRLVESYPQSDRFNEVIEREFRIANLFFAGKKGKLAGLEILPSLPRAAKIFEHIINTAPYSQYGDQAQFHLGLVYKKMKRFGQAADAFQAVIDKYPQSPLVAKARFQLAESSYMRSSAEFRDQRALDEASRQVDKFLTRYPDSETSEKAAALRQAIDEKNAEKNYRIGAYYEKDNFLDSAVIYFGDVAARYPNTVWGKKAAEKLKSLKEPASFISGQEKEVTEEIQILEAKIKALGNKDPLEKEQLERKLDRAKKRGKHVEKNKKESVERRRQDLQRRERELKLKFKNLEAKKKLMKTNPSEDFKRAIERWHTSIVAEQESLAAEKSQLTALKQDLGLRDKKFGLDFIPFMGEAPTDLDRVRQIEAKKLYKLSEEKKNLLEDKEVLYKQHGEVTTLLREAEGAPSGVAAMPITGAPELEASRKKLEQSEAEIKRLEEEISTKSATYEKNYGKSGAAWVKAPAKLVGESTEAVTKSIDRSLDLINPFHGKPEASQDPVELALERRMHLQEKIAAQENLVETLSSAFDAELALREKRRLLSEVNEGQNDAKSEKANVHELRKQTKKLERDIRAAYENIEDRHKRSKALLKELDALLKKDKPGGTPMQNAAAPVVKTGRLVKAFFVGLPHEEVEITDSAKKTDKNAPDAEAIAKLREQVEFESLMIDAKNREILSKQRELEVLKAKASLSGGYKFRPVLVRVPYVFMGEAIDSARRVIPKKNREEILINRLNEETKKLEDLKTEIKAIEKNIPESAATKKTKVVEKPKTVEIPADAVAEQKSVEAGMPAAATAANVPDEKVFRKQLDALIKEREVQVSLYNEERKVFESRLAVQQKNPGKNPFSFMKNPSRQQKKKSEKLRKELKEIEQELTLLIKKESTLEVQEALILEKRIKQIDKSMKGISSKALSQDLLTERERMESRFAEIQSRRDFLSKELERFQVFEASKPAN